MITDTPSDCCAECPTDLPTETAGVLIDSPTDCWRIFLRLLATAGGIPAPPTESVFCLKKIFLINYPVFFLLKNMFFDLLSKLNNVLFFLLFEVPANLNGMDSPVAAESWL